MRETEDGFAWVRGVGLLPFETDEDLARVFAIVDDILTAHYTAWVARMRWRYELPTFEPTVAALSRRHAIAVGPEPLDLLTDRWPIGPPAAPVHRELAGMSRAA